MGGVVIDRLTLNVLSLLGVSLSFLPGLLHEIFNIYCIIPFSENLTVGS